MFYVVYLIPVVAGFVADGPAEVETVEGQYAATHRNVDLGDDILKVGNWTLRDGRPEGYG